MNKNNLMTMKTIKLWTLLKIHYLEINLYNKNLHLTALEIKICLFYSMLTTLII